MRVKFIDSYGETGFPVIWYHEQVEVYVNHFPRNKNNDIIRIVLLCEPTAINDFRRHALYHQNKYDYLVTFDELLLKNIKKAVFAPAGGCWVTGYKAQDEPKKFSVSFVCGGKGKTSGHILRRKIWLAAPQFEQNKDWYISKQYPGGLTNPYGYPSLDNGKDIMFNNQFHIAIENSIQVNYFTEKIIDCFYTKTVPIYYGCPNIEVWFNKKGIIFIDSLEDAVAKINALTPETYNEMREYIEDNYRRSLKYCTKSLSGNTMYVAIPHILNMRFLEQRAKPIS